MDALRLIDRGGGPMRAIAWNDRIDRGTVGRGVVPFDLLRAVGGAHA